MRMTPLLVASTLAIALTACGDGDDDPTLQPPTTTPGASSGTPSPSESADDSPQLTARDFSFSPAAITVPANTTLRVRNRGQQSHTFTTLANQPVTFDVPLEPGEDGTVTLSAAGSVKYRCEVHPTRMSGTITVTG